MNETNNTLSNNIFNTNFYKKLTEKHILILEKQKKILLQYILKIADFPTETININSSDRLVNFLSLLKEKNTFVDENLSIAQNYINSLKQKEYFINPKEIANLLTEYYNISSNICNCITNIENFFIDYIDFIKLDLNLTILLENNNKKAEDSANTTSKETKATESSNINQDITHENLDKVENTLTENTLIISEKQGKVILPYKITELNKILIENSEYNNIQEIIDKNFVIPYTNFKNPIFSRFKEAFKLVRNKEHGSIKEAFDLGMELLFNYNLHPAIISACSGIDELDIYLDYLENNEIDKFDCFNIKFEISPMIRK